MALKLTWKQLNESAFVSALVRLNNERGIDGKNSYRIGRICQTAEKEMEKARKLETDLIKDFQIKDDKGELLLDDKQQPQWIEDGAKKFGDAFNKLMEENIVEIKVHELDFASIKGLTPMELVSLTPILTGLPNEN